jgi:FtsP/CotA-like multicopper oxidase with cupredoxin domain
VYPNDQRAATLWYHDHAMHHTGRNVYMGLAGLYLLHDEEEEALGLPAGPFDVPLIIWERSVDGDGRLHYGTNRNLGAEGDVVLVNGVPWPRMEVCARRYRFRVLNGSNASLLRLALSSGRPFVQIATDGGLLPSPVEHASVPLAMAERAELVVDFSPYPVGTRIVLRNLLADDDAADIMAFDVVCDEPDPTAIPARLSSVDPIRPRALHRRREFTFAGGPASFPPVAHWTVNGLDFDPDRPIATPRLGDVEVWRIVNRKRFGILGMVHPVHLHLVNFQIIGRNGVPPGAHDAGWKDTVAVPPGESATIIARFESYRGRYLVHCHNLEHEDQSMMARYDVV